MLMVRSRSWEVATSDVLHCTSEPVSLQLFHLTYVIQTQLPQPIVEKKYQISIPASEPFAASPETPPGQNEASPEASHIKAQQSTAVTSSSVRRPTRSDK